MSVIKVLDLPRNDKDKRRQQLRDMVATTVTTIPRLDLRDRCEIFCRFTQKALDGVSEKISIEINGLSKKQSRTRDVRKLLADVLSQAVKTIYPEAMVEVSVHPFNPEVFG